MTQNTKSPVIVFDFGGVLIDWNPYYLYRSLLGEDRQVTEQFLQEVDFYNWNLENDRGRSFEENAAELIARFPQHRELIWAYHHRFIETVAGLIQPTVVILHALKKAGYPVWGLSNWPADKFAQVRPLYDFFNHLDGMVVSGEVGLVKPERHIFDYLVEQVGRPAGDCLFIDDNERNIIAARELGFQTILFRSAEQLAEELTQRGILV
jgi:2-haloacid dehalogenase